MMRFFMVLWIGLSGLSLAAGTALAEDRQASPQETVLEDAADEKPDSPPVSKAEKAEAPPVSEGDAKPQAESMTNEKMVFNFDDADLIEVIRTLADLLKINYVLDPGVGGKVTIHTAGELDQKDLFPVFYQLLEVNGLTAIRQQGFYRIVPVKNAPRLGITSKTGEQGKAVSPDEEIIIQIIRLKSVSATEISKLVSPFISSDGVILTQDSSNLLVLVDKTSNIRKVLRLVQAFDIDVFETIHYRFYPIENEDAETVAGVLEKMFASYGPGVKDHLTLIPLSRLNAVLVVSSNPRVFDELDGFIKTYDAPSQNTEPGIYVYPIKNGQAADIADLLNTVFTGKKEEKKGKEAGSSFRNPLEIGAKQEKAEAEKEKPPAQVSLGAEAEIGSGTLRGDVKITADEYRNSLIIEAAPDDYQIIKSLLVQLDVLPRQVLIEVTIAEITLDKSTELGVEWNYVKNDASMSSDVLSATMGSAGLRYTVGNKERWTATMSALASHNKVNILSSPTIIASNSKPAKIDISTEVPVASSQYDYTSGDTPVISTDIQYRDTGVMLSVTPNVNELGLVTMEIEQEVSEQAQNVQVGDQTYPSFFKRAATTTLTVQDGQTIVIGGLIKETTSKGASGAPWFIRIPVINFLFGKTSESFDKTELILLISPHVISQMDDVDVVTKEFTEKLKTLVQDVEGSEWWKDIP